MARECIAAHVVRQRAGGRALLEADGTFRVRVAFWDIQISAATAIVTRAGSTKSHRTGGHTHNINAEVSRRS